MPCCFEMSLTGLIFIGQANVAVPVESHSLLLYVSLIHDFQNEEM